MIAHPDWYSGNSDFDSDQAAHVQVCNGASEATHVHRAARHHHWRQSDQVVRGLTGLPRAEAAAKCQTSSWTDLVASAVNRRDALVTHLKVANAGGSSWRKNVHENANNAERLRDLAILWHIESTQKGSGRALWLGHERDVNANAPFDADNLHRVIAALGLWHYGEMAADTDGAVLRISYTLDETVQLFKPDWRHAFDAFYFATTPGVAGHGLTRNLQTGDLQCKEWVAPIDKVDPKVHLLSARYMVPSSLHDHYELTSSYWSKVRSEILANRGGPP